MFYLLYVQIIYNTNYRSFENYKKYTYNYVYLAVLLFLLENKSIE